MTCPTCAPLLQEILARLDVLEQRVRPCISPSHTALLEQLLPAIRGKYGTTESFTIKELFQSRAIAKLIEPMNPSELGKLFLKASRANHNFAGFTVRPIGSEHARRIWLLCNPVAPTQPPFLPRKAER